jgi:hypothetical protein
VESGCCPQSGWCECYADCAPVAGNSSPFDQVVPFRTIDKAGERRLLHPEFPGEFRHAPGTHCEDAQQPCPHGRQLVPVRDAGEEPETLVLPRTIGAHGHALPQVVTFSPGRISRSVPATICALMVASCRQVYLLRCQQVELTLCFWRATLA